MIEALIERAVQAALYRSMEHWLREVGLPPGVAQEMCSRLLTHDLVDEELADAAAATALDVEDEDDLIHNPEEQSLPSEVPMSACGEEGSRAETPTVDELLAWVVPALEDGTTWSDIPRAAEPGHDSDRL